MGKHLKRRVLGWLRRNLFQSWVSALQTVVMLAILVWLADRAFSWLVLDAVWRMQDTSNPCPGDGFCWPVLTENLRLLVFGFYPDEQIWRAYLGLSLMLLYPVFLLSRRGPSWSWSCALLNAGFVAGVVWILFGGLGLDSVKPSQVTGLLLTLLMTMVAIAGGLPGGILLTLARQSKLFSVRLFATGFLALFRALPTLVVMKLAFLIVVIWPFSYDYLPASPFLVALLFTAIAVAAFADQVGPGLAAAPEAHREVAVSLGLKSSQINRHISVPYAVLSRTRDLVNVGVWLFVESSVLIFGGLWEFHMIGSRLYQKSPWITEFNSIVVVIGAAYLLITLEARRRGRALERFNRRRTFGRPATARRPLHGFDG